MPAMILVVDDESHQRFLFRRLFKVAGFETTLAASAEEALEMLAREEARPDLILTDIAMRGLDGVSFLKVLKKDPHTADIPAILMTGLPVPQSMLDATAAETGLGAIFIKGTSLHPLLTRVEALLKKPARAAREVRVDSIKHVIWIGGRRLPPLPSRRFQVLCALIAKRSMSREELLAAAWDGGHNPNVVDVTILRLRQDLKRCPGVRIETIRSGYRLVIE